jgi:hypothetical protein
MVRVQIGGDVVRREAEVEILARDVMGRPTISHMRPKLYAGEILCERIGMIPVIVRRYA